MAGDAALPASLRGVTASNLTGDNCLMLKSRSISDADCAVMAPHLKENKALRQLYIGYNSFGDEGAQHLCEGGGQLDLLGLRHCQLGDGAAAAVAELLRKSKTLTEVGIDENQISDAGAEALGECASLRRLYVGENQITDVGRQKLMASKP